ncbi:unnamed protein product, partial [Polarella glacialis]
ACGVGEHVVESRGTEAVLAFEKLGPGPAASAALHAALGAVAALHGLEDGDEAGEKHAAWRLLFWYLSQSIWLSMLGISAQRLETVE